MEWSKNIFKGAFEALVGIAKAPLNTVIGLVNTAISGLNKVSVKFHHGCLENMVENNTVSIFLRFQC